MSSLGPFFKGFIIQIMEKHLELFLKKVNNKENALFSLMVLEYLGKRTKAIEYLWPVGFNFSFFIMFQNTVDVLELN